MTDLPKIPLSKSDTISVVLCCHGDRAGDDRNRAVVTIRKYLEALDYVSSCRIALLSQEGSIERSIKASDRVVIFIPLLFSDGYFFRKIESFVCGLADKQYRLMPHLAANPYLINEVALLTANGEFLIVAHGSAKSAASRKSAEALAMQLRMINASSKYSLAYLEEEPFANNVVEQQVDPSGLVGLFLGEGLHGGSDWQQLVDLHPGRTLPALTVGSLEKLPQIVENSLRDVLSFE